MNKDESVKMSQMEIKMAETAAGFWANRWSSNILSPPFPLSISPQGGAESGILLCRAMLRYNIEIHSIHTL